MTPPAPLLLDEHVSRVFERVLRERGFDVVQAKDRFGERTVDETLLQWCGEHDVVLLSNNARDFEALDRHVDHAGVLLYSDHALPYDDPEGLARAVELVFEQYGTSELTNELIDLEAWYTWLHE